MTPALGPAPGLSTTTPASGRDGGDPVADGGFERAMQRHEPATRDTARAEANASASRGERDGADTPAASECDAGSDEAVRDTDAATDAGAAVTSCSEPPIDASAAERMLALLTGLAAPATPAPPATTPPSAAATTATPALLNVTTATSAAVDQATLGATAALAAMAAPATRDTTLSAGGTQALAAVFGDALRDATATTTASSSTETTPAPTLALTGATPALATAPRAPAVLDAVAMPATPGDGFDDAFGARIAWMAEQKLGHAELRVTPADAGPIDIRLQVDGTRIRAEFNAVQADTRAALEASIPRLRDMLGAQGLQLAHADVGQRHGGQDPRASGGDGAGERDGRDHEPVLSPAQLVRSRGLLDEYA